MAEHPGPVSQANVKRRKLFQWISLSHNDKNCCPARATCDLHWTGTHHSLVFGPCPVRMFLGELTVSRGALCVSAGLSPVRRLLEGFRQSFRSQHPAVWLCLPYCDYVCVCVCVWVSSSEQSWVNTADYMVRRQDGQTTPHWSCLEAAEHSQMWKIYPKLSPATINLLRNQLTSLLTLLHSLCPVVLDLVNWSVTWFKMHIYSM